MNKTNWRELVGKRVLVKRPPWTSINEWIVKEVSPSGELVKLQSANTSASTWGKCDELTLIEVLP